MSWGITHTLCFLPLLCVGLLSQHVQYYNVLISIVFLYIAVTYTFINTIIYIFVYAIHSVLCHSPTLTTTIVVIIKPNF